MCVVPPLQVVGVTRMKFLAGFGNILSTQDMTITFIQLGLLASTSLLLIGAEIGVDDTPNHLLFPPLDEADCGKA